MFGLFGGAAPSAAARISPKVMAKAQPSPRPRGLFGSVRNWANRSGEDGISNADRLATIGAMLRDDPAIGQNALQMQQQQRSLAQQRFDELQAQEGQRNTAQKEQLQARQRLDQQAGAIGMDPEQFALLPPETRQELISRRFTPDEPDRPTSFEEYSLSQRDPAYRQFLEANPRGTQVNVNGQRGQVSGDYVIMEDQSSPAGVRFVPIPGSEAAAEAQAGENAAGVRQERDRRYRGVILDEIDRAESVLQQNPGAAGLAGQVAQRAGGTMSHELDGLYDTIGGYIARDTLQGMRDASPTGGALGSVSEEELSMLRAAYGSLRVSDRPETQTYNLQRLRDLLNQVVHGEAATAENPQAQAGGQSAIPDGTIIENDAGERMVRRNGRWERM